MAIIRRFDKRPLEVIAPHTEVHASYTVVELDGCRFLQIDTYGSAHRMIKDKKSQSIRLAPEAIQQLREILEREV